LAHPLLNSRTSKSIVALDIKGARAAVYPHLSSKQHSCEYLAAPGKEGAPKEGFFLLKQTDTSTFTQLTFDSSAF
jgi:hypothetical protein